MVEGVARGTRPDSRSARAASRSSMNSDFAGGKASTSSRSTFAIASCRSRRSRRDHAEEAPPLYTNIDLDLQEYIHSMFADTIAAAAVAMVPQTGELTRQDERATARIELAQVHIGDPSAELDVRPRHALQSSQGSGPLPTTRSLRPVRENSRTAMSTRLYGTSSETIR